jgi:hypothetical protein
MLRVLSIALLCLAAGYMGFRRGAEESESRKAEYQQIAMANEMLLAERAVLLDSIALLQGQLRNFVCIARR